MRPPSPSQCGMTLVELMVAMVIGLGVTLAITTLLIAGENHKRTTTSTNDAEQTGAYVSRTLDGMLRGAGSAIAQSGSPDVGILGCKLNAGGPPFPRVTPFPKPFSTKFLAGNTANLRVTPLLIAQNMSDVGASGSSSDVLMVMGGSGAAGGVPRQNTGTGSFNTLVLDNTVGFALSDLALVSQSGTVDCLLEQVTGPFNAQTLTVGGTYYTANGTTTNLTTLSGSSTTYVTPLGNSKANNLQFLLFGVGANRTLYSYDLLQNLRLVGLSGGDVAQPIADGVDSLHAIYGVDTTVPGDGVQDTWLPPTGAYSYTNVMTNEATMRTIVSVRVALVVRSEYYDKNLVSPAQLTLFGGLTDSAGNPLPALVLPIALTLNDRHYRYRVFEFTVPLRNMILLAKG